MPVQSWRIFFCSCARLGHGGHKPICSFFGPIFYEIHGIRYRVHILLAKMPLPVQYKYIISMQVYLDVLSFCFPSWRMNFFKRGAWSFRTKWVQKNFVRIVIVSLICRQGLAWHCLFMIFYTYHQLLMTL
jgi:hypothetical protein